MLHRSWCALIPPTYYINSVREEGEQRGGWRMQSSCWTSTEFWSVLSLCPLTQIAPPMITCHYHRNCSKCWKLTGLWCVHTDAIWEFSCCMHCIHSLSNTQAQFSSQCLALETYGLASCEHKRRSARVTFNWTSCNRPLSPTGIGFCELVESFFSFGISVTLFQSDTPNCALKQGDGSPATIYPLKTESSSWPFFRILRLK